MGSSQQSRYTVYPVATQAESRTTQPPVFEYAQFWEAVAASYLVLFVGNQFLGDTALGNLAHMSFSNPDVAEWVATYTKSLVHPVMDAVTFAGTAVSLLLAAFKPPR